MPASFSSHPSRSPGARRAKKEYPCWPWQKGGKTPVGSPGGERNPIGETRPSLAGFECPTTDHHLCPLELRGGKNGLDRLFRSRSLHLPRSGPVIMDGVMGVPSRVSPVGGRRRKPAPMRIKPGFPSGSTQGSRSCGRTACVTRPDWTLFKIEQVSKSGKTPPGSPKGA
jgi:hypothetical protein